MFKTKPRVVSVGTILLRVCLTRSSVVLPPPRGLVGHLHAAARGVWPGVISERTRDMTATVERADLADAFVELTSEETDLVEARVVCLFVCLFVGGGGPPHFWGSLVWVAPPRVWVSAVEDRERT